MAEYERHGGELERSWARLTDPDSPQTEIQTADAVRRHTRKGAEQAVENLMQLAETLERSAGLAEEHARRREREGRNDQAGEERAAGEFAHDAARRARAQARTGASGSPKTPSATRIRLPPRSSTRGLAETSRLPDRPGVAALSVGRKPGPARSVEISVALGDSSSLALALLLDQGNSQATDRLARRAAQKTR